MMSLSPEVITAIGGAVGSAGAAIAAAFWGGKKGGREGGENSLNGFKEEVREGFRGVHLKLDILTKTDGEHDARLGAVEKLARRRILKGVIEDRAGYYGEVEEEEAAP